MNWNDQFEAIQAGDVFVKQWGKKSLVHVMLPNNTSRWGKQKYMRLDGGGIDSTYNNRRSSYGNTSTDRRWHYVGTIPTHYLTELIEKGTLR